MQQMRFLDTTVQLHKQHISTYLKASSFHPEHTTKSTIYSQGLQYKRIGTEPIVHCGAALNH